MTPLSGTVKGHEGEAPGIEGRQTRRENSDHEGEIGDAAEFLACSKRRLDDGVLGIEPCKSQLDARNADAGNGQRADGHHGVGDRQILPEAAHLSHILLVVHPVDHRTCA